LNSRLAAGTYLGLVPVRLDEHGRHHFGFVGEVVDWAVHMLRLPDELRGDERLAAGTLSFAHVDKTAAMMADFHARAPRDAAIARWGSLEAIRRNVRENFAEIDAAGEELLTPAEAREVESWQLDFLASRARTFDRRVMDGRIREGHGDLRLEHLYFGDEGELTIIDCIEFSERFRCADVCADVAFLSMDLAAHGRVDLAERFLARYARAADDYDLYAVVDFYEGYRAYVRGKVSALTARQSTGTIRDRALADARRHFALALSTSRRSLLEPVVVAVGGVIASGKSTVADALGDRLSAPVIDADRTRKHLLGLAPIARDRSGAFQGPYDLAMTDRVYAELMMRASTVLESGRPVVIDASFRTEEMRRAARDLAAEHGVPFLIIECRARPEVCRERLARRERETSVSDGRLAIFDAFCARVEPWNELSSSERLVVDTERPLDATLAVLDEHLRGWPPGLTS
jgi:aminoglycoside phosphotransferase family enzyme/predicted kinase